jgi:hypothetical protein
MACSVAAGGAFSTSGPERPRIQVR